MSVQPAFREALVRAGLAPEASERGRTLHGLRHSFAVDTLIAWYRDGGDIEARLPALSTHMGHIDPRGTYWYFSAVPELLGLAALRLERVEEARP